jgi:hypothetical protein
MSSLSFTDPSQLNLKRVALTTTSTTETYTYTSKNGDTLLVIVITYTDSTKATIDHIDRTVPTAV